MTDPSVRLALVEERTAELAKQSSEVAQDIRAIRECMAEGTAQLKLLVDRGGRAEERIAAMEARVSVLTERSTHLTGVLAMLAMASSVLGWDRITSLFR